jgi:hypothetical protein
MKPSSGDKIIVQRIAIIVHIIENVLWNPHKQAYCNLTSFLGQISMIISNVINYLFNVDRLN